MISILVLCKNLQILQTITRLIEAQRDWVAEGLSDERQSIERYQVRKFDVVLIGTGIDPLIEKELKVVFHAINPDVKIVRHYGGGSGLLYSEIRHALESKNLPEEEVQNEE